MIELLLFLILVVLLFGWQGLIALFYLIGGLLCVGMLLVLL